MISLGNRYTDYGLTGGFFLFLLGALFIWLMPIEASALLDIAHVKWTEKLSLFPKALEPIFVSICAAIFIICVFFAGLFLDLLGSILVLWEADVFRKHLVRGKTWILPILEQYEEFLGDDVNRVITEFDYPFSKSEFKRVFGSFAFWKARNRKAFSKDQKQSLTRFRLIKPFSRIQSVLLSHIIFNSEPGKLEVLTDQLRLCRISRAISSGIFVLVIVAYILQIISLVNGNVLIGNFPNILVVITIFMVLSVFFTVRAYSRFCLSLFSLVLVMSKSVFIAHDIQQQ